MENKYKITISELAVTNLKKQFTDTYVRIGVRGSGCSGYSYVLKSENHARDTDLVFDVEGLKVVIDSKSMSFLNDINIDYQMDLQKQGYVFNNPNMKSSCGCGKSFSV